MKLVESRKGVFISNEIDGEGYYHLFADTSTGFTHTRIRPDPASLIDTRAAGESMHALLEKLEKAPTISACLRAQKWVQVEYKVANPVQKASARVSEYAGKQWQEISASSSSEEALEKEELAGELWDPVVDLVARGLQARSERLSTSTYTNYQFARSVDPGVSSSQFTYKHIHQGVSYGEEKAVMHAMVQSYIKTVQGQLHSLRLHLKGIAGKNPVEEQKASYQILYLEQVAKKARKFQKEHGADNFLDSNYYRDLIKESKQEWLQANGYDQKTEISVENWRDIHEMAAGKYIPFLANCWKQSIHSTPSDSSQEPERAILRAGAFYDSRCALFSLDEFYKPDGTIIGAGNQKALEAAGQALIDRLPHYKMKGVAAEGAIAYALSRLCQPGTHKLNLPGLVEWLSERQMMAQSYFLDMLQQQVESVKAGQKELGWLHLSLLKPFEDKVEKSGWTHSEKYQGRELKWAFDHFRGAKLSFADPKEGPFPRIEYSATGKPIHITLSRHLVKDKAFDQSQSLNLESHCVGCSVAAPGWKGLLWRSGITHKKKDHGEVQKNQAFFNEGFFARVPPSSITDAKTRADFEKLQKGESDFYLAESIALEMMKKGWAFSTGCQSGKDRTGYVCSRIAQRFVVEGIKKAKEQGAITESTYKAATAALDRRPLEAERITQQILYANTGAANLKVGVLDLPGRDPLNLNRIAYWGGSAKELFFPSHKTQKAAFRVINL